MDLEIVTLWFEGEIYHKEANDKILYDNQINSKIQQ